MLASDTNVYRGADGKLHGKSYGPWRSTSHSRKAKSAKETLTHSVEDTSIDQEQCLEGFDEVISQKGSVRKENRLKAFARHVLDPSEKDHGLEAERGTRGALHAEPHHELDGFVHHDAHHPFALPDDDDHEKEDDLVFGRHRAPSMSSVDLEEEKRADWHHHDVEVASDSGFAQTLCLLYTSPSPRDATLSRMPSSA